MVREGGGGCGSGKRGVWEGERERVESVVFRVSGLGELGVGMLC